MIENYRGGDYELVKLYEVLTGEGESEVVRWCKVCGAVVIDIDFDGRIKPGAILRMRSPLISKVK